MDWTLCIQYILGDGIKVENQYVLGEKDTVVRTYPGEGMDTLV